MNTSFTESEERTATPREFHLTEIGDVQKIAALVRGDKLHEAAAQEIERLTAIKNALQAANQAKASAAQAATRREMEKFLFLFGGVIVILITVKAALP